MSVMFNVTMKLSNVSKRKNKETIEYEKKNNYMVEKKNNVMIEPSNVSKNKNKRTAKYDKSMVSCILILPNVTLKKFCCSNVCI